MTALRCYTLHGICIEAYCGDITKVNCDVIVCASNRKASRHTGLLGTIKKAGGSVLESEIIKNLQKLPGGCIEPCQILVTGAGKMPCKHVMYVDGVAISHGDSSIADAIITCLQKAKDMKFQSIAFPALGSGQCGLSYDECVNEYVKAMSNYHDYLLREIHFVIFEKEMFNKIKHTFEANFLRHPPAANSTSNAYTEEESKKKKFGAKSNYGNQPKSENTLSGPLVDISLSTGSNEDVNGASGGESENCPICLCPISEAKTLDLCGHVFCQPCIDHSFSAIGQYCPICLKVYGVITGNQPASSMVVHETVTQLPGFEGSETYQIEYHIPSGIQGKNHPNPGQGYYGTDRTAFLPKTEQGTTVLKMLQLAFNRRLLFTVGKSRTTNIENMVTWNDVHHKTSCTGGPSRFGYPDADYLDRVTSELSARGITPEDVVNKKVKHKIRVD